MKKQKYTKDLILDRALMLATKTNYNDVTRVAIAKDAEVTESLISYYFGDMKSVRDTIIRYAVEKENLIVIAQALVNKNKIVASIPATLKGRALETI